MDYKHSCVVDAEGCYKTVVLQRYQEVYRPPATGGDGTPDLSQAEPVMAWVVDTYVMEADDWLIDTALPPMRLHAGEPGLVRPRWDEDTAAWVEGAAADEIAAWEVSHPAQDAPGPTPREQLRADVDYLAALGGVAL